MLGHSKTKSCDRSKAATALAGKVKTALDETRTLILGAQILLGFQYQAAFQERFGAWSSTSRQLSALALAFMLLTVSLLVAPSAFHRIAEDGQSTRRMHRLTGYFAALALLPFAAALGLDLTIVLERAWGQRVAAAAAGVLFTAAAAAGWYGVGLYMRRTQGAAERDMARTRGPHGDAPLHARIEQTLTEARVILPGAQALLGFQLVIVLSSTFEKLPASSRLVHGLALLAIALTVVLLITPAALHRIVWSGEESEAVLRIGGRITTLSLLPLALGIAGDAYVVWTQMTGMTLGAAIAGGIVLLVLLSLWYAWPLADRLSKGAGMSKANRS